MPTDCSTAELLHSATFPLSFLVLTVVLWGTLDGAADIQVVLALYLFYDELLKLVRMC